MNILVKTTLSASGQNTTHEEISDFNRAKQKYHAFLGQMVNEPSVLYCMASILNEFGESVMKECWYKPEEEQVNE